MGLPLLKQAKLPLKTLQRAKRSRSRLTTLDIDFNVESSQDIEIGIHVDQYRPVTVIQTILLEIRILLVRRSQALRFIDKGVSQKRTDGGLERLLGITWRILRRPCIRRNAFGQIQE